MTNSVYRRSSSRIARAAVHEAPSEPNAGQRVEHAAGDDEQGFCE
jgi:hypothetical protein